MTGNTTTLEAVHDAPPNRARHSVRLPMVRNDVAPSSFIFRTASTASQETSCVFGHDKGSRSVFEKTTLDNPANTSVPGSPSARNRTSAGTC